MSRLNLLTLCSIRFAHPSRERFWVLAHSDSVMVFKAVFHCKSVKLIGQIRGRTLINRDPMYIFDILTHH